MNTTVWVVKRPKYITIIGVEITVLTMIRVEPMEDLREKGRGGEMRCYK